MQGRVCTKGSESGFTSWFLTLIGWLVGNGGIGVIVIVWLGVLIKSVCVVLLSVVFLLLQLHVPSFSGVSMMVGTPSLSTFGSAACNFEQDLHIKMFWTSIWVRVGAPSCVADGIAMGGIHLRWRSLRL